MAHRALPLTALAFASLSFGTGCPKDDAPAPGGNGGGGDGGAGDAGADPTDAGGDGGAASTGGTSNAANDAGASFTNGALSADAEAAIQGFGATACALYLRCDPSGFAAEFGDDDGCREDLLGYYATFYTRYGSMAEDPAACSAAVESYFDCLEAGYADMTCADFDSYADVDCFELVGAVYTDCEIPTDL